MATFQTSLMISIVNCYMKLYLAHSDAFFTGEISLHLQMYFPRDFLMVPPERGKGGVSGNQINVK